MTKRELFERLMKLEPKDTDGHVELAVAAERAGIMDPDTAEILSRSVDDQEGYFEKLDEAFAA
jgi:hypothetical protein